MAPHSSQHPDADLFGQEALIAGYRPPHGVYDEMLGPDGAPRPAWRALIETAARLGPDELSRRADSAARRLRDAGVTYRLFEAPEAPDAATLSVTPLVLSSAEWRGLAVRAAQRASAIEAALKDFYGPQTLIHDGVTPAAILGAAPAFLRPMIGAQPKGGRHLRFYALDLARGEDGRWRVLGDRAEAASGAGLALANRLALRATLPELIGAMRVRLLAGFFQEAQLELSRLSQAAGGAGICVLTAGPGEEAYYEHAYLARYLGFHLVEGEDLAVHGGEVFLRAVAGLMPVDVMLRRMPADLVDPLEFDSSSAFGAPGLAGAARAGRVAFANALGSGVANTPALAGYWEAAARRLLGESLTLPSLDTYWCGDAAQRAIVMDRFEALAIGPAFEATRPGMFAKGPVAAADLSAREQAALRADIAARGMDYVGFAPVRLSTMPVWRHGRFTPQPVTLRLFLTATETGWSVMPGGLCRVGDEGDARGFALRGEGQSADVWVLADASAPAAAPLSSRPVEIKRGVGALTTRTADNMFWLGRYLERADAALRLIRAAASRASERDAETEEVAATLSRALFAMGAATYEQAQAGVLAAAQQALTDPTLTGSAPSLMQNALRAASKIRDAFSPDAWRAINALAARLQEPLAAAESECFDRADEALLRLAALSGFVQENMTRTTAWTVLEVGRRIERGVSITRFCAALGGAFASSAALDCLLELSDSQVTYARRYFITAARAVRDLILFDESNPRACAFQAKALRELSARLPKSAREDAKSGFRSSIVGIEATLSSADVELVDADFAVRLESAFLEAARGFAVGFLQTPGPNEAGRA